MKGTDEQRISDSHRERAAVVYVRQSSPTQVREAQESTRAQFGLRERAIELGWPKPIVIEDDLGISASGFAERPGFQKLLTDITMRLVGVVLAINACRLSRNSKDWAHLFELCGYFDTLVADVDQVYDLSIPNDRLVLGIKGTIAEMELSVLKSRLKNGAEAKAARGELKFMVPPGYSHDSEGQIVLDPNRRIREAITNMFSLFHTCTSVRQLALLYKDTKTLFPVRKNRKERIIEWEIPTASNLSKLLTHPIYTGAYIYGRRNTTVEYKNGRLVKRLGPPLPPEKCRVFRPNDFPGYITWEQFEANRAKIAEAKPRWNMQQNKGAIRDGLALLSGVIRCGQCGRKLYVAYKKESALYYCDGGHAKGSRRCLSFGSKLIDKQVSEELCSALKPVALDASITALKRHNQMQDQLIKQAELRLQEAQYKADSTFEQYDLVDPKNRLVADSLEERLNQRLSELQDAKKNLDKCRSLTREITNEQQQTVENLSQDFTRLWNHPKVTVEIRKKIIRAAIEEIIVKHLVEQQSIEAIIHWKGGIHTRILVKKRSTPVGSKAEENLIDLVRRMADTLHDAEMARILNMQKKKTPRGLPWTLDRVREFRRQHRIKLGNKKQEPDLLTGQQAAEYLDISRNGLAGLIRVGFVHKHQVTDFAPWRISRAEIDSEEVQKAVRMLKATGRVPKKEGCPENQTALFPMISEKMEKEAL